MADDILKSCKKYVIQIIINPSTYWITKFESGKYYRKEMEIFKSILAKHVAKFTGSEIPNESLLAVEQNGEFYRGLIMDVFNRNSRNTYSVLLIDYGNIIETTKDKIYLIQSKRLKEQLPKVIQVSVHGIQPIGLDIDDKHLFDGIFQKRKCDNWSPNAFEYVKNLFVKNPFVFLKVISSNEKSLTGDIYFIQSSDGMPVSLGQKLCDEGFAVHCDLPKHIIKQNSESDWDCEIEKKIPQNAFFQDIKSFKAIKQCNESLNTYTKNSVTKNDKSELNTTPEGNINNYSSSWILKKYQLNNLTSSSKISFTQKDVCDLERQSTASENFKVNLLKVAMRTVEHFEKNKQNSKKFMT